MNERKTEPPAREYCTCPWFDRAAEDPAIPVRFDAERNEFHLVYEGGHLMFYFCPFCGGRAPKSVRDTFFALISPEEEARLQKLAKDFKTVADVRAALGPPDRDRHILTYRSLSATADVVALADDGELRGVHLSRKYIKKASSPNAKPGA